VQVTSSVSGFPDNSSTVKADPGANVDVVVSAYDKFCNDVFSIPDAGSPDITMIYLYQNQTLASLTAYHSNEFANDPKINFDVESDASYSGTRNGPLTFNVEADTFPLQSTTTLSSSANPSIFGQSVTFQATVIPSSPGVPMPTGTVTFKDGSTAIGSGKLNASGVATFATSTLPLGSDSIKAVYGGDSDYTGSTSAAVTQTGINRTWTGAGTTDLWSDGNNWLGGVAPTAGSDLVFPSGALQETSVDVLGFVFNSITTADTYSFSGQPLTTGSLTVSQGGLLELDMNTTVTDTLSVPQGAFLNVGDDTTQVSLTVDANATLSLIGNKL
jgi:hypothetical protein